MDNVVVRSRVHDRMDKFCIDAVDHLGSLSQVHDTTLSQLEPSFQPSASMTDERCAGYRADCAHWLYSAVEYGLRGGVGTFGGNASVDRSVKADALACSDERKAESEDAKPEVDFGRAESPHGGVVAHFHRVWHDFGAGSGRLSSTNGRIRVGSADLETSESSDRRGETLVVYTTAAVQSNLAR